MLDEGAGERNALDIADAIDYLGASLSTGSGWDGSSLSLYAPVARLDAALEILAEVALRPTFPGEELARLRKEHLTSLLQARDEPRALASAAYQRALFGPSHRFGVGIAGREASIEAITLEEIRGFYRAHYAPGNAACLVVGDLTAPTIIPRLEKAFGSWKSAAALPSPLPPVPQVKERETVLVDKPGAAQSELRFVRMGVARKTPDFYALLVMNTILGGSFTSRLNTNLREEHGYSYGAGSFFDMRRAPGPFVASTAVETAVTNQAVAEVMKELSRMREPVPPEELERAKNYLILGYPADFETTAQIASKLAELALYDLPDDFFNSFTERIRAVSAGDVLRVAKGHLDPARTLVVVVGDRKEVEPGLRKLRLGPLRLLTVDDVVGKPAGSLEPRRASRWGWKAQRRKGISGESPEQP